MCARVGSTTLGLGGQLHVSLCRNLGNRNEVEEVCREIPA
jgi:hypothetical protein